MGLQVKSARSNKMCRYGIPFAALHQDAQPCSHDVKGMP
jgi:hypothetical protein